MDFDLRDLEIFCAVVEQSSFTRAAERVHLAQASVSERITKLEQSIGGHLLHRSTRRVSPTALGSRLYRGARHLLAERQSVVNDLADLLGVESGELEIGASTIPGEYMLPAHLASFKAAHPGVSIRVLISGSEGIATRVEAGELEIGVIGSGLKHPDLETTILWHDELVVATSHDHRWSGRSSVTVAELCCERIVMREAGSGTRCAFEAALNDHLADDPASLEVAAELGSMTAVKEAVLGGLGVSVMSTRALLREVEAGIIGTCRIEGVDLSRSIVLVRHRRRSLSPAAAGFAEHLLGRIRSQSESPIPTS